MGKVWTIAEQSDAHLKPVSFELLARGRKLADKLGTSLVSIILSDSLTDSTLEELIERGADEVICIEHASLKNFVCETFSRALVALAKARSPEIILAAATSTGRTLMPHMAVSLHAGLTADCTELDIEDETRLLLQTRPAIGGNIMATIRTPDHKPQMATVRPKSSRPLERDPCRKGAIERIPLDEGFVDARVKFLKLDRDVEGFENIEEASIVVSGGRGLKKADNFKLLSELAAAFTTTGIAVGDAGGGGVQSVVVGASREAVDRGWISYPHQVGLSGKTISPRLYLCAGISGAIQHLAGIKTAGTIVSINSDPEAAIHAMADFAIVGDLFEVLPRLRKKLEERAKASVRSQESIGGSCVDTESGQGGQR
jgi:electron transfer flavoprotein alpha subunit